MKKSILNFSISLKLLNSIFALSAVLITSLTIHFLWYESSSKNITTMTKEYNNAVANLISARVRHSFDNAKNKLLLLESKLKNKKTTFNENKIKESMLALLDNKISDIAFGYKNGDFFGVRNKEQSVVEFGANKYGNKENISQFTISSYKKNFNKTYDFVSKRTIPEEFDPRKRPWYKIAEYNKSLTWTKIFDSIMQDEDKSINASKSIIIDGEFIGVASIGLQLSQLSKLLSKYTYKHSEIRIFNLHNQTLASSRKDLSYFKNIQSYLQDNEIKYTNASNENIHIKRKSIKNTNWTIEIISIDSDFLEEINEEKNNLYIIIALAILIILLLEYIITQRYIYKPIEKISKEAIHISNLSFTSDAIKKSYLVSEIKSLSKNITRLGIGVNAFRKYLPHGVVQQLINKEMRAEIGGAKRNITVIFTDLYNFTQDAEKYGVNLINHLEEYFNEATNAVTSRNGVVDKYIGDSIMAFWGAPHNDDNHALNACLAAIEFNKRLASLRKRWEKEGKSLFHTRIGINTGDCIVGNIGSKDKLDYTVLGSTINMASRLERLNKFYQTSIIIGEDTYKEVKDSVVVRKLGKIVLYGANQGMYAYELLDTKDNENDYLWAKLFNESFEYIKNKEYNKAISNFEEVIRILGKDISSEYYIEKCKENMKNNTNMEMEIRMEHK